MQTMLGDLLKVSRSSKAPGPSDPEGPVGVRYAVHMMPQIGELEPVFRRLLPATA